MEHETEHGQFNIRINAVQKYPYSKNGVMLENEKDELLLAQIESSFLMTTNVTTRASLMRLIAIEFKAKKAIADC